MNRGQYASISKHKGGSSELKLSPHLDCYLKTFSRSYPKARARFLTCPSVRALSRRCLQLSPRSYFSRLEPAGLWEFGELILACPILLAPGFEADLIIRSGRESFEKLKDNGCKVEASALQHSRSVFF